MLPLPKKRPTTAEKLRRRMNWWAPLLFTGIQITYLSEDYTHCRARYTQLVQHQKFPWLTIRWQLICHDRPHLSHHVHGLIWRNPLCMG